MAVQIRTKINVLFFSFLLGILLFVLAYSVTIYQHERHLEEMQEQFDRRELVDRIQLALCQAGMPVNDFLIAGADPNEEQNYKVISERVENSFEAIRPLTARDAKLKDVLSHLEKEFLRSKEIALRIFAAPNPVGNPAVGRMMEEVDTIIDEAIASTGQYHHIVDQHIQEIHRRWKITKGLLNGFIVTILFIYLAIIFGAQRFLKNNIASPLMDLKEAALRLSRGDFEKEVNVFTKDEIGEVASAFNQMTHHLKDSYQTIQSQKEELEATNTGLIHINEELDVFKNGLEEEVKKRTQELGTANQELAQKIQQLERYNKVMVDRELKMRELKEKIKVLEERLGGQS